MGNIKKITELFKKYKITTIQICKISFIQIICLIQEQLLHEEQKKLEKKMKKKCKKCKKKKKLKITPK